MHPANSPLDAGASTGHPVHNLPSAAKEAVPAHPGDRGLEADRLRAQAEQHGLSSWQLAGRRLLPIACSLRDGKPEWGQFCIDKVLGHAQAGDVRKGLFFRGAGSLPFGSEIRSVNELFHWLVAGLRPQPC